MDRTQILQTCLSPSPGDTSTSILFLGESALSLWVGLTVSLKHHLPLPSFLLCFWKSTISSKTLPGNAVPWSTHLVCSELLYFDFLAFLPRVTPQSCVYYTLQLPWPPRHEHTLSSFTPSINRSLSYPVRQARGLALGVAMNHGDTIPVFMVLAFQPRCSVLTFSRPSHHPSPNNPPSCASLCLDIRPSW